MSHSRRSVSAYRACNKTLTSTQRHLNFSVTGSVRATGRLGRCWFFRVSAYRAWMHQPRVER